LYLTNKTSLTTVNLQQTFEGDVQELNLDFTIVSEELGQNTVEDLKPNGSETPVTNDNRIEYIHLVADYKLNRQIRTQCNAFR
jgi:ubiquitin-protein ligase E3 C